jgi:hypothetical protein
VVGAFILLIYFVVLRPRPQLPGINVFVKNRTSHRQRLKPIGFAFSMSWLKPRPTKHVEFSYRLFWLGDNPKPHRLKPVLLKSKAPERGEQKKVAGGLTSRPTTRFAHLAARIQEEALSITPEREAVAVPRKNGRH